MAEGREAVGGLEDKFEALTAISEIAEAALKNVKMTLKQAGESDASAEAILAGVRGISEESRDAARELDRVRISEAQATESTLAGERIKRNINDIGDEADRTKRKLEEVRIAGGVPGRSGVGVGPFGSGFGRIGVLGSAIGTGVLTAPAAGPAAFGLLGATGVLGGALVGSVGTLALAFHDVGKAIEGDKKAFDGLQPSAQQFVTTVRSLSGWLDHLRQTAGANLFPGLEHGLRDALSPGTLHEIDVAVEGFARAIGTAGEQWGRYFGSPQFQQLFGPLMREGARDVELLSDSLLHLVDGVGVVARAGIGFNEWMLRGIDQASRLADEWLNAKSASGELGHAMSEAETSLRLVLGLVGALTHAGGALGEALYPVSKVAVKDLTDGLNALARVIHDNEGEIRDVVGGALAALVTVVKDAAAAVRVFWPLVEKTSDLLGGWQKTFEMLIGLKVASTVLGWAGAFNKLAGPEALGGATMEADLLLTRMTALARIGAIGITLQIFEELIPKPPSTKSAGGDPKYDPRSGILGHIPVIGTLAGWGSYLGNEGLTLLGVPPANAGPGAIPITGNNSAHDSMRGAFAAVPTNAKQYTQAQLEALWVKAGGDPKIAKTMAAIAMAESHGRSDAANYANSDGSTDRGLWQINSVHGYVPASSFNPLSNARQAVSVYNSQGLGAWTTYQSGAYLPYMAGAQSPFGSMPDWTKNVGTKTKPTQPTGAALLSEVLRNAIASAKNKATAAAGPSLAAHWLNVELDDLEKARKQLAGQLDGTKSKRQTAIRNELRSIDGRIADVNKQITTNLKEQATAIKQSFASKISTAKAGIASAVDLVKQTLDAQFEQATQSYIDTVLGPKYFQGTDAHGMQLQTPLEKQLADMQAADSLKNLQDAIDQATDPQSLAAAQRAKDEYLLSIDAAKERAQADHDYAEAVRQYQADRAELERQLNAQIDAWGKGLADGTTKLDDLAGIVDSFGVSLTAKDGIVSNFSTLGKATHALALVLAEEAKKLAGIGDNRDAGTINDLINEIVSGDQTSRVIGGNVVDNAAFWALKGLPAPIGMADGGMGRTLGPTLFYSGGGEDYAFSGEGTSFADQISRAKFSGGGDIVLVVDGREIARAAAKGFSRDPSAGFGAAKAIKPHLPRVVTLSK
jgi:hypothetical protein